MIGAEALAGVRSASGNGRWTHGARPGGADPMPAGGDRGVGVPKTIAAPTSCQELAATVIDQRR